MKDKKELKKFPPLKSDQEAEEFVEKADLAEYDFSDFKSVKFEFKNKSARINMRIPEGLLDRIKKMAKKEGVPYSRFIREILENHIEKVHH